MSVWRRLELLEGEEHFLMACNQSNDSYEFHLTDCTHLYTESLKSDGFKQRIEEINPDLEISTDEFFSEILKALDCHKNITRTQEADSSMTLTLNWKVDDIPLMWKIYLRHGSAEQMYNLFTAQLIKSMGILQSERTELFRVIRAKDIELGEFKSSGMKMSRPHLRTEWFEPAEFLARPTPTDDDPNRNSRTGGVQFLSGTELLSLFNKVAESNNVAKDEIDNNPSNGSVRPDTEDEQEEKNTRELEEQRESRKRKAESPKSQSDQPTAPAPAQPPPRPKIKVKSKKTAAQKKLMKL